MYITPTNIINYKLMAEKAVLDSAQIQDMIEKDIITTAKLNMNYGVNYYNAKHDYLDNKNTYVVDGKEIEDLMKANNLLVHPFHKIFVNQKVAYICGNPIVVSIKETEIENEDEPTEQENKQLEADQEFNLVLNEYLGNKFNDLTETLIKGASNKGLEWLHFYVDKKGELNYVITPAEQIIAIYDMQYQDVLKYIIRYYGFDFIDPVKKELKTLYKVEWWTDKDVTYYEQQVDGTFIHDPNYTTNPSPHWSSFNTKNPGIKQPHSWGKVPFICLPNNSDNSTDLEPIKTLIDAYDKVKSGWCNDLHDFQELIYVLKNYAGLTEATKLGYSELGFFIHNLRTHKAVNVDENGDVTTLKAEIPVEAKEKFLQITRKEIFYFGEAVDISDEQISSSPSGVSLKILYAPLDMKANRMINKLKLFLSEFMEFVVQYINFKDNTSYEAERVLFTINKSTIFNENEKISSLQASETILSERTILENHPYVNDVEEELARKEADRLRNDEQNKVDLDNEMKRQEDVNKQELIDENKDNNVE